VAGWRLGIGLGLVGLVGVPLLLPFADLVRFPEAWRAWEDVDRLRELAVTTALLVGGVLLLDLPAGVLLAALLYRSDLPGRRVLRVLVVLALFVPLPLAASAWQAALGTTGWLPLAVWSTPPQANGGGMPWKPWAQGPLPAVWVHALAGLPWLTWIAGQGLRRVERELEEDALLSAGPWTVFWHVTLPRSRAAIVAAALWVGLQTANEITVSDMMAVRTFAEEVYLQFVRPEVHPDWGARLLVARATAVSVPLVVLTVVLVWWAAWRWQRTLPPLESVAPPLCLLRLGRGRWPCLFTLLLAAALLLGVPLASLVWKAGLTGSPEGWSATAFRAHLAGVLPVHGRLMADSLLVALAAGLLAAALALVSCWLALDSIRFRLGVLALMAVAWAMPGPLVGIGLKETIHLLLDGEEAVTAALGGSRLLPLKAGLYEGPSLLPVIWAVLVRFYPYATAILWPAVRMVPRELRDLARVDGALPAQELARLIAPLAAAATLQAFLAVAVLSLGELSAGKLVETPGGRTFAHAIFEQMHYGVTNRLAALCLFLLALAAVGSGLATALPRLVRQPAWKRSDSPPPTLGEGESGG
jgi:iron(III) transport system permease protein